MAEKIQSLSEMITSKVTHNRKRLMIFGVLSIIFGLIGSFMSFAMTITSVLVFGIFIILVGLIFLFESFSAPEWKGKLWGLLISIVYILAGIIMIIHPAGSAIWFTLFLAALFMVIGLFRIIAGFQLKDDLNVWGWMVFVGVINFTIGLLISIEWPASGLWVIGLFISIELIMQGISAVVLSSVVKEVQKEVN